MLAIFKKRQFSSKEIFYQCKSPFAKTFLAFSHKILENSHIFKFFVVLAKRNANFYWFVAKSSHFGYFCIYSHQKNLVATPSSKQPHWLLIATFGNTDGRNFFFACNFCLFTIQQAENTFVVMLLIDRILLSQDHILSMMTCTFVNLTKSFLFKRINKD